MRKGKILLTITNGFWLIEESAIGAYMPLIASVLKGDHSVFTTEEIKPNYYSVAPTGAVAFSSNGDAFNNTPAGSTAIINICGPIMKYDNCGDAGTQTYGQIVKMAIASPNIGSIVLKMDSPGGEVAGTEDFAKIIKESTKPIVAYVDGLMASAAYWLGSQCKEIYAGNFTDRIGSIGTMCSFADVQPFYEKQGVVFHDIYADASSEKNKDYQELRKKNYALTKERLNDINDIFLASVKEGRGEKLDEKETLTGKVFMANDAVKVGLVDGVKSFDDTIARAQELSKINPPNNKPNPKNNMKVKVMLSSLVALLFSSDAGFKADETELTEAHLEKVNAELATLAKAKADLKTAQDAAEKASTDLIAEKAITAGLTKDKETLAAEVTRLGGESAGATNTDKKKTDVVETKKDVVDSTLTDADRELAAYKESLKG